MDDDFLFEMGDIKSGSETETVPEKLDYPELKPDTWKELFALAAELRKLEPWEECHESDWFGLTDTESEMIPPPMIGTPSDSRAELLRRSFASTAEIEGYLPQRLMIGSPRSMSAGRLWGAGRLLRHPRGR